MKTAHKRTQHGIQPRTMLILLGLLLLTTQFPACGPGDKPIDEEPESEELRAMGPDPVQPDAEHHVDIGRWYDMTWQEFDNLYADFARNDPPMVRNYGICDSIACHFPSTEASAKAEILICYLDGVYTVDDAFHTLGIEFDQVGSTGDSWISVTSADDRFIALQYKAEQGHADRTTQLLLQFNREDK
ncbi:MAG: hypothetical protein KFH87_14750 [Bacteroidetes bacterium]|nr:hypothetical protein [Bacteroidota bacterium]